jgi:hypothetical protein
MLKKLIAIIFFLPLLGSACQFGNAHFKSELKSLPFNPNGTVFAYLESENEKPMRLHVMMTWISIDPTRDLNDFSDAQQAEIKIAFKAHDALSFTVDINTSKITDPWINLDDRIEINRDEQNKKNLLSAMTILLEKGVNYYAPPLFLQGRIEFHYAARLISGNFTAPILQGDAAQIAKKNWEELRK